MMPSVSGPEIERPLFIIGVGRSGSSIFHQMFSRHPQVAWLSSLAEDYPERIRLNRLLMTALDFPLTSSAVTRFFDPGECYPFWDRLYGGFGTPCRDLVSEDVTVRAAERIRNALASTLTARRRRLLIKITGWPRIGFLKEIFPDARFIHVLRDGRPVASSLLNVDFWWGWRGPANWRWGPLTPSQEEEWDRHARSFVALAGIQWKILMDALEAARGRVSPDAFHEIRYEELCADPVRVFRAAVDFAGLEWSDGFERTVRSTPLSSENEKWRRDFSPAQQRTLEDVLGPHLDRYGYR
jgi:hypothetical protein